MEPVAVLGGVDKAVVDAALSTAREAAGGKLDKAKKKVGDAAPDGAGALSST